MTYRELLKELNYLDDEQLDMDVVVYDNGESDWFPVTELVTVKESDVLDRKHPYFLF